MLLVGAVDIALGWAWHTVYRAKHHWSLKREGALAAAALVALFGAAETIRTLQQSGPVAPAAAKTLAGPSAEPSAEPVALATPAAVETPPALTADATPTTAAVPMPEEITPSPEPVATIAAAVSPEPVDNPDPIGAKIMERLGDEVATGSLDAPPEAAPAKPKAKPAKRKTAEKRD